MNTLPEKSGPNSFSLKTLQENSRVGRGYFNRLDRRGKVEVVRPRRFELLTYSFGGCRSIQLSYGRVPLA